VYDCYEIQEQDNPEEFVDFPLNNLIYPNSDINAARSILAESLKISDVNRILLWDK
jgi:hypothetical protein